jgi:hypothetical protein
MVRLSLIALSYTIALSSFTLSDLEPKIPSSSAGPYISIASLSFANTSILNVSNIVANSYIQVPGTCITQAHTDVGICRIYGKIYTSSSSIKFEVWLPRVDNWYGRLLSTGNGGLSGC